MSFWMLLVTLDRMQAVCLLRQHQRRHLPQLPLLLLRRPHHPH
jgi:hypothetical protein